jgi:RNA polymerase sigma factor for flagellar operon FliA
VRLETLVYRDGYRLDQAAQLMHTAGETTLTDRELGTLLSELPARTSPRPVDVGAEPLDGAPASTRADDLVLAGESTEHREATDRALAQALQRLAAEDRVVLRMRYWEGLSVADVARALAIPQKPLYRRIERALAQLRTYLERAGVSRDDARALLSELSA